VQLKTLLSAKGGRMTYKIIIATLALSLALSPTSVAQAADIERAPTAQEVEGLVRQARSGNPQAQYRLAMAYELGKGTRQSFAEAVRWYTEAANQGFARAQFNLAQIYEEGRPDVKRDLAYALSWYEEAARNGFKMALDRLRSLTSSSSER